MTDAALLQLVGTRLAGQRAAANLTQAQLAEQAGLGLRTIQRMELGASATQLSGFLRVCRVLGLLERLDTVLPEPAPSPIALLAAKGRTRRRVRSRKDSAATQEPWTWRETK
jgi:transcriptional regulator with XRE-family HTH domain